MSRDKRKRRLPYCGTCAKFLINPAMRLACEQAGHSLTTKAQTLTAPNGLKKRCQHKTPREWASCPCPWYYNFTMRGKVHRGVLGKFEHRLAAEAALGDLKKQIHEGRVAIRKSEPTSGSFADYAQHWLDVATSGIKASTKRFYGDHLKNHVVPLLGARPLADLDRADVKHLIEALTAKKLRPHTVGGVVRTLSTVLSEAVDDGKLAANPAFRPGRLRRRMKDPNAPRKIPIDPYTREEVAALIDTARTAFPAWYPFLLCALRTGMRLGELRALQWGQIDWRGKFISVERNHVEGVDTTPKNGKARRVDMSPQLAAELRLSRRRLRLLWFSRGLPTPDLVFPSDARTPLDDSNIRKALVAIVGKAEVRRRSKIVHVMRHTYASLLIEQGESLAYIRDQMGHSSIQVTVDVYGHLVPGGNRKAVARLDDPRPQRADRHLRLVQGVA
jgi:integrase